MTAVGTVVLPVAGRSTRFPGLRPKWLLTAPTGELMLEKSLATIPDWRGHRVVVGALAEHLDGQGGFDALRRAFGETVEVVRIETPTRGPAETVARILEAARVDGPVFVKDCDSWFEPLEEVFCDCVCFGDLRRLGDVRNVAAKSFLHLDGNGILLGIIEKNVTSNFVSVGGYGFHDARIFLESYARLLAGGHEGEPFVSHVILDAMRGGAVFKGVETKAYVDVGTLEAWNLYRRDHGLFVVDVDGVVFRNAGQYGSPNWDDPDVPLPANVEVLRRIIAKGGQIVFMTARPERYRAKTEAAFRELGLTWHAAVFGLNHATRTIVNDFAGSNPFPSAVAVNLARNDDRLGDFVRPDER
ncbi:NTP transferase domain-containing protein [Aureimonas leprariae]|uniref:NTP transferase domain-containing protein n=1 Tax=Plantimonas leprariae TaxID=2615207 RepID=A0A7V7PKA6_9HYPH|nr:NTP transferase domain-containing protein [Aureimonas leprariae]KAB0676010.1 NTP transferase domain-containing protein [Aureimonas leprariae]